MFWFASVPPTDYAQSLLWVKTKVDRAIHPPAYGDDGAPQAVADDAIESAQNLLRKYGAKPEACRLLGLAQMERGQYGDAASSFRAGGDVADIARADASRNIAAQFEMKVPGRTVLHAKVLHRKSGDLWAIIHAPVGSLNRDPNAEYPQDDNHISEARLTLWSGSATYTSPPLVRGDLESTQLSEVSLYAVDLDGDGSDEAVVDAVFYGADWTPSALLVVSNTKGKWTLSKPIRSEEPGWIEDIDHDGRVELGGPETIGRETSHAEQPRWPQIYNFAAGKLVRNDSRYPSRYVEITQEVSLLLNTYPTDFELLAYRGRLAQIAGKRSEAARYEAKALAALARARRTGADISTTMADQLRAIVRRN